jgi:hypothetical protein
MREHLHQPDIDRLSTRRGAVADPVAYRHLNQCEPCLRRLIDEVLRLASVEESPQAARV